MKQGQASVSKKDARQRAIVAELNANAAMRTSQLAEKLGVSAETIRRDIEELTQRQMINRTYGGATGRHVGLQPVFDERTALAVQERRRISQRDLFALVGRHCLRKFLAAQEDRSPLEGDGPKLYGRPTGLQGRQRTARRGDDPRLLRARRRALPIHALLLPTHLEIHAAGSWRDLRSNERRAKDDAERKYKDPTCGPGKAHGRAG